MVKIIESKLDYREPIKCLQNSKGDYINVYKIKNQERLELKEIL